MALIKSPCCPGNPAEDLAFTMFVLEQENALSMTYADQLDDLYAGMERDIDELEYLALYRPLTPEEKDTYLYLCKETGAVPEDWVLG